MDCDTNSCTKHAGDSEEADPNMEEIYENDADELMRGEFDVEFDTNGIGLVKNEENIDKLSSLEAIYPSDIDFGAQGEDDVTINVHDIENSRRKSQLEITAAECEAMNPITSFKTVTQSINAIKGSQLAPPTVDITNPAALTPESQENLKELKLIKQKNIMLGTALSAAKQKAAILTETLGKMKIKLLDESKARASANELAKALAKAKSKIEKGVITDYTSTEFDSRTNTLRDVNEGEKKLKEVQAHRIDHESNVKNLSLQREKMEKQAVQQAEQSHPNKGEVATTITSAVELARRELFCLTTALVNLEEEIKLLQHLRSKTGIEIRDHTKYKCHQNPLRSDSNRDGKGASSKSPIKSGDFIDLAKKKIDDLRKHYQELVLKAVSEKESFAIARDKYFCLKSEAANLKATERLNLFNSATTRSASSAQSIDTYDGIYEVKSFFHSNDHGDEKLVGEEDVLFDDDVVSIAPPSLSLSPTNHGKSEDAESKRRFQRLRWSIEERQSAIMPTTPPHLLLRRSDSKNLSIASIDHPSTGKLTRHQSMELLLIHPSKCERGILRNLADIRDAADKSRIAAATERNKAAIKIQEAVTIREEAELRLVDARKGGNIEEISSAVADVMSASESECAELQVATDSIEEELEALKEARSVTEEAMVVIASSMARYAKKTLTALETRCVSLKGEFDSKRRMAEEEYVAVLEMKEKIPVLSLSDREEGTRRGCEIEGETSSEDATEDDFEGETIDEEEELEIPEEEGPPTRRTIDVDRVKDMLEKAKVALQSSRLRGKRCEKCRLMKESEALVMRISREKEEGIMLDNERSRAEEEVLINNAVRTNDQVEEARY